MLNQEVMPIQQLGICASTRESAAIRAKDALRPAAMSGLLSRVATMIAPYPGKAVTGLRLPPRRAFEVVNCDFKAYSSS